MDVITRPEEMAAWSRQIRHQGRRIGFVPTMGFFHEGHLALMRMAAGHADVVVVSLFVNPIQFGENEDLDRYPSNWQRDCNLAEQEGVALLFAPDRGAMYPDDFKTTVSVAQLPRYLCGADRPGHFDGVTTVVCKLFNLIRPHVAVFGEKDYQQLAIIRQMVRDLNMGVDILAHPIVREPDGLAMSSRNSYLDKELRKSALSLSRAARLARRLFADGKRDTEALTRELTKYIQGYPAARINYITLVDSRTLAPVEHADENTLLALAVTIGGKVRLIDNTLLAGTD